MTFQNSYGVKVANMATAMVDNSRGHMLYMGANVNNENITQEIRNKLVRRYKKFYQYWKDFTILVAFLALVGLMINIINWDLSF